MALVGNLASPFQNKNLRFGGIIDTAYNTTMKLPSIVIDTNVIITALRSKRGASAKLLPLVGTGRFDIHISVPLVLEYEEVLLRQRVSLGLTPEDVADLVDGLSALAHHHQIYFLWRPYLRDKKDEMVLELAVVARCDYIITYNKNDFKGSDKFGIEVITPREFLEKLGELS
jgi:putative PIN family toxin of toxin-antitoxin system